LHRIFSKTLDLLDDSDEEKEAEKDLLQALLLIGKYLSNKEERSTFYLRKRMGWKSHIAELTSEGPEAFQKMLDS